MIINKIIEDICKVLILKDNSQVIFAIQICKEKGILDIPELKVFINYGIPITNIGARILQIDAKQFISLVTGHKISYGDTCMIIGAFAQQIMVESQYRIMKQF